MGKVQRYSILSWSAGMFCLLFLLGCNKAYAGADTKNILILNSYHQSFAWTDEQTQGVIETLKSSKIQYELNVEYMDWKKHPEREAVSRFYNYLVYKYANKPIDHIVTTDDAAVEFALKYRADIFSNAPIIFSGVNEDGVERLLDGYSDITGIVEEVNPKSTIQLAREIIPELKKIYLVHDSSESGLSTGKLSVEAVKEVAPDIQVIPMNHYTRKGLIQKIREAENDSVVLMTTYTKDFSGAYVDFQDLCREVSQNSSIPIFQLYDFGMGYGAVGGTVQSGRMQGQRAGELAIQVLKGTPINELPIQRNTTTYNMFDHSQLKRFNISTSHLPKDSKIINEPFSFAKRYRLIIIGIEVIFAMLLLFISILLVYIRNINKMKRQLKELAYLDALTSLPNRLSLNEKLMSLGEQKSGLTNALMFIDTDNFKYINDTLGHFVGDEFIRKIGQRIDFLVGADAVTYRLGGDEFVVLFEGDEQHDIIKTYAEKILASFKEPFSIGEHMLQATVSIGIALYPEHTEDVRDLLKFADIAMYRAKEEGRNKYVMYDEVMNTAVTERMNIEKYLRGAIRKNEFFLNYQPQVNVKTGKIMGFEALARWHSPELGFVSPQKFIAVAEDTHFIIALGDWILEHACLFIKKLHQKGYSDYCISINVSVIQLMQDDFEDNVIELLNRLKLDPRYIELEITESVLAKSFDAICSKLERLREKGINIALDDFGKEYSSLNYLKQLPITTLKIDKTFIDTILNEDDNKSLTGLIVLLGLEMGLCVVAEGVETKEQLDYLLEKRCDKFQGYLAYKPLAEEDVYKILEKES